MQFENVAAAIAQTSLTASVLPRALTWVEWRVSMEEYFHYMEALRFTREEAGTILGATKEQNPHMGLRQVFEEIKRNATLCACMTDWHACEREHQYALWALYGAGRTRN